VSATILDILTLICIFGVVTLGLDLIVGYARIFSINQALLFGIGAFSYAFCFTHLGTSNLLVAWLIATPIAGLISAIVALISLRVAGDYFVVASFGIQAIGLQVIYNWQDVSGGASGVFGLPYPTVFGWQPQSEGDFFLLAGVVAVVAYTVIAFLLLSPYGRLVMGLGQDEQALAAAGFDPLRLKVSTFVLGGMLAAIAGVLYGGYNGIAQVGDFSLDASISLLAMVIVGGAGRIVGSVFGAGLLVALPHLLDHVGISSTSQGPVRQALFGVLLLVVILFFPSGASGAFAPIAGFLRRRTRTPALAPGTEVSESVH
jgi:branched-chain amino acid transport system permease protein